MSAPHTGGGDVSRGGGGARGVAAASRLAAAPHALRGAARTRGPHHPGAAGQRRLQHRGARRCAQHHARCEPQTLKPASKPVAPSRPYGSGCPRGSRTVLKSCSFGPHAELRPTVYHQGSNLGPRRRDYHSLTLSTPTPATRCRGGGGGAGGPAGCAVAPGGVPQRRRAGGGRRRRGVVRRLSLPATCETSVQAIPRASVRASTSVRT